MVLRVDTARNKKTRPPARPPAHRSHFVIVVVDVGHVNHLVTAPADSTKFHLGHKVRPVSRPAWGEREGVCDENEHRPLVR